jgi:hypothetical protein
MTKIIVTIEDDVCLTNGKTAEMQAELLRKIAEYGKVEDYATHIAKHDAEWNSRLANMTAQYNGIVEYGVTDTELAVLKALRLAVDKSVQVSEAKCAVMEGKLKEAEEKATALATAMRTTLDAYSNE